LRQIKFIDLFCGVGGIRLGMQSAGFECVFSSDINLECQKTYEANFSEKPFGDITCIDTDKIPNHDILCAGFPCQPFSISGKQKGFDDTRGTLFFEICRILEAKKPSVVMLENVKHLMYHNGRNTLSVILQKLEGLGYSVSFKLLNASNFGVAQNRERIIIIGTTQKTKFDFSRLKQVSRKHILKDIIDKEGEFEYMSEGDFTLIDRPKIQSSGLIFAGYRNKSFRKAGVREGTDHLSRVHKQPNRIYSVWGVHPTLPSQESSGRYFILLEDNKTVRKLTINECWRLMGFPEDFKKISKISEQYKQLGNSVAVGMIAAIAKEIKIQLFNEALD
jgi:DNA (cytosine-5-)-methyltransferase